MQISNTTYPNVYRLLGQGEEDVTMEDIVNDMLSAGLSASDLPTMEAALADRPEYQQEVPFPGEDDVYDLLVKNNIGFANLQKFMSFWW